EVGKIIKHYGYRFARGMMTDVMTLKENGLPVSCANIACGYYNPHQDNEYVSVDDVINCRNMVFEIIGELGTQRFGHTYTPRWQSTYSTTGGRASYAGKDDWYTKSSKSWWDEPDDNWNPGDWVKGADGVYRKKKDE